MKYKTFLFILTLPLYLIAKEPLSNHDDIENLWLNIGFGNSSLHSAFGMNLNVQFNHPLVFQLGYINTDSEMNRDFMGSESSESADALSFALGIWKEKSKLSLALLTGISRVYGYREGEYSPGNGGIFSLSGEYEKDNFSTWGIMANVQLFVKPVRCFGAGIEYYRSWNSEWPFYSVLFSIQVGP